MKPPADDHAPQGSAESGESGESGSADEGSAVEATEASAPEPEPEPEPPPAEPLKVEPTKRKPGVYALCAVHSLDEAPHAYVLGCAQVTKSKRSLLGPAACAKLLKPGYATFLGYDSKSTLVKLAKGGTGFPCPDGSGKQPWLTATGMPTPREGMFVVGPGVKILEGVPEPATLDAIRSKNTFAGKRHEQSGAPTVPVAFLVDLDGDGVLEVVTENLGSIRLFRADGTLVGEVGCEFG